jgi:hypothetical protein
MDVILPPMKRRRTRKDKPLVEGDAEASQAVTFEIREVDSSRKGKITKSVIVPLMSPPLMHQRVIQLGIIGGLGMIFQHMVKKKRVTNPTSQIW